MDVHSVHNASCLYVHIWAKERGKEVNYACRCRVAQSTAKDLFAAFQTENATHEFDMAKNHCRRVLQTEGWTCQQWSLQWTQQIIKPHVIHLHIRSRLKNGGRSGSARIVFFVHCSCISMKTLHIFFSCYTYIDPLHRKQTLTLSQCNSRDLTDSPHRNLEKSKKCSRYLFANRHLFHEHSAYI